MIQLGTIVDNKYKVIDVCSNSGGMGEILFVEDLGDIPPFRLVLKYCKKNIPEAIQRFSREIRNLDNFKGNSKVLQIYDSNLEHDPPYFVMPYYPDGDLTLRQFKSEAQQVLIPQRILHEVCDSQEIFLVYG